MPETFYQSEALARAREDIAMHEAQIKDLRGDIAELKAGFLRMQETLDKIKDTLAEARGGWKTLMKIGGAGAAAAAGMAWLIDRLPHWLR